MWEKLLSWARFLWDAGEQSRRTAEISKENQKQIETLVTVNQILQLNCILKELAVHF